MPERSNSLSDKTESESITQLDSFHALVQQCSDAVFICDEQQILFANDTAQHMLGKKENLLYCKLDKVFNADTCFQLSERVKENQPKFKIVAAKLVNDDSEAARINMSTYPVEFHGKQTVQVVIEYNQDKAFFQQINKDIHHDPLTGLPNRELFMDRLEHTLKLAQRYNFKFFVAFIDLDRFKRINDTFGHHIGDKLLKEVTQRITSNIRDSDTLARLGGDEFIVLLNHIDQNEDGIHLLNRIVKRVSEPMNLDEFQSSVTCSVGCSAFPLDGKDADTLIKFADTAMYAAKESGRNSLQLYHSDLRTLANRRMELEKALRQGLERQEFELYYQPQVDLRSGNLVGLEALLRWNRPDKELIGPAEFIPIAEDSGVIIPIGEWVLENVTQQVQKWTAQNYHPVKVAINLSAKQIMAPGLDAIVEKHIKQSGIDPHLLELELTESISMDDPDNIIPLMERFRKLGVGLSIDDFGTGYSNMKYLREFPIDVLKIDGSFIAEMVSEPGSLAIVEAIIEMSHRLGLKVVAERAESEGEVVLLAEKGCDIVQGYFFSQPLPVKLIEPLLKKGKIELPSILTDQQNQQIVLILDDEKNVTQAIRRELRQEPYELLIANSTDDAFEILAKHHVGVVLSDYKMPGMNGIEFLSRVRRMYPAISRVLLSAIKDFETAKESINRGAAHHFLDKPWNTKQLMDTIEESFVRYSDRIRRN